MNLSLLKPIHPFSKVLFAVFITLVSMLVFLILSLLFCYFFMGVNITEGINITAELNNIKIINALKLIQIMQNLGLFIVPPFLIALLYSGEIKNYLSLKKSNISFNYFIIPILILCAIPLINLIAEINSKMIFPESLTGIENWMKAKEVDAEKLTNAFLKINNNFDIYINILMIGIMPALGEELLFRGIFQKLFGEWTKNFHAGIWISAALFSLMHFQFYGFVPRLLLGVMFGYLLVWTGSIWIPILAHFFNNTIIVLFRYYTDKGLVSKSFETVGSDMQTMNYTIIGSVLTLLILYTIWKKNKLFYAKRDV